MSEPKKPETDLTDEELEKVAGGGGQPHMGPAVKVEVAPGPPELGASLTPPGPPEMPGLGGVSSR